MRADRRRLGLAVRIPFALVGLGFLAVAFHDTWDRSRQHVLPSGWDFGTSFALVLLGLVLAARGWASLLSGQAAQRSLARGFYTSQLGKYVPGAVWQAAGQVGLAKRAGVTTSLAVTAFPVHAIAQATAGGTVGAALVVAGLKVPLGIRLASLSGLVLLPLLRRTWIVRALYLLGRLLKQSWSETLIPSQERILRAYGYGIATLMATGAGFMVLAASVDAVRSTAACIPAFALAWTVGYLALPFPSGVGVREAVLIVLLAPVGGAAPVIGASVAHRLVTIAAEVAMIVWAAVRGRARQPHVSVSRGADV